QAELMESRIEVLRVFHLSCPERSTLIERLKKRALKDNRLDDANEAVIRNRLETYEMETKPILNHYDAALIHTIDATQSPARVLWEILGVITGTRSLEDPARNHRSEPGKKHRMRSYIE